MDLYPVWKGCVKVGGREIGSSLLFSRGLSHVPQIGNLLKFESKTSLEHFWNEAIEANPASLTMDAVNKFGKYTLAVYYLSSKTKTFISLYEELGKGNGVTVLVGSFLNPGTIVMVAALPICSQMLQLGLPSPPCTYKRCLFTIFITHITPTEQINFYRSQRLYELAQVKTHEGNLNLQYKTCGSDNNSRPDNLTKQTSSRAVPGKNFMTDSLINVKTEVAYSKPSYSSEGKFEQSLVLLNGAQERSEADSSRFKQYKLKECFICVPKISVRNDLIDVRLFELGNSSIKQEVVDTENKDGNSAIKQEVVDTENKDGCSDVTCSVQVPCGVSVLKSAAETVTSLPLDYKPVVKQELKDRIDIIENKESDTCLAVGDFCLEANAVLSDGPLYSKEEMLLCAEGYQECNNNFLGNKTGRALSIGIKRNCSPQKSHFLKSKKLKYSPDFGVSNRFESTCSADMEAVINPNIRQFNNCSICAGHKNSILAPDIFEKLNGCLRNSEFSDNDAVCQESQSNDFCLLEASNLSNNAEVMNNDDNLDCLLKYPQVGEPTLDTMEEPSCFNHLSRVTASSPIIMFPKELPVTEDMFKGDTTGHELESEQMANIPTSNRAVTRNDCLFENNDPLGLSDLFECSNLSFESHLSGSFVDASSIELDFGSSDISFLIDDRVPSAFADFDEGSIDSSSCKESCIDALSLKDAKVTPAITFKPSSMLSTEKSCTDGPLNDKKPCTDLTFNNFTNQLICNDDVNECFDNFINGQIYMLSNSVISKPGITCLSTFMSQHQLKEHVFDNFIKVAYDSGSHFTNSAKFNNCHLDSAAISWPLTAIKYTATSSIVKEDAVSLYKGSHEEVCKLKCLLINHSISYLSFENLQSKGGCLLVHLPEISNFLSSYFLVQHPKFCYGVYVKLSDILTGKAVSVLHGGNLIFLHHSAFTDRKLSHVLNMLQRHEDLVVVHKQTLQVISSLRTSQLKSQEDRILFGNVLTNLSVFLKVASRGVVKLAVDQSCGVDVSLDHMQMCLQHIHAFYEYKYSRVAILTGIDQGGRVAHDSIYETLSVQEWLDDTSSA